MHPGDFVVHQDHGIGRFEGLTKIESEGVEREYLLIHYAGTDRLYIPTDQLDRITRYIGMGDAAPALSKLGGAEWARAKQRTRENVARYRRRSAAALQRPRVGGWPSLPAGRPAAVAAGTRRGLPL